MAGDSKASVTKELFIQNSKPRLFYLIPCKRKRLYTELITEHGGEMAAHRQDAQYILYNPGDIVSNPKMVSTAYIDDCVELGASLDIEQYRYSVRAPIERAVLDADAQRNGAGIEFDNDLNSQPSTSSPRSCSRRTGFSSREDMSIIEAVLKQSKHHSINGTRLWEILAAQKVTTRTGLSMKERFVKRILPYAENYKLGAKELKKLKSLSSSKSDQVVKGRGRMHLRSKLPFLTAPAATQAGPQLLDSSSSSDDSLGPNVLVPHVPVSRKRKAPVVELFSSSSQSENSQQSQKSTRTNTITGNSNPTTSDMISNGCGETSMETEQLKGQMLSPEQNLDKKKTSKSKKSTQEQPSSSNQSTSESQKSAGSQGSSLVSYVIEDPSPDSISHASQDRNDENSESMDLGLLTSPRKVVKKLPSVVIQPLSESTILAAKKQPAETAILTADTSVCRVSCRKLDPIKPTAVTEPQSSTTTDGSPASDGMLTEKNDKPRKSPINKNTNCSRPNGHATDIEDGACTQSFSVSSSELLKVHQENLIKSKITVSSFLSSDDPLSTQPFVVSDSSIHDTTASSPKRGEQLQGLSPKSPESVVTSPNIAAIGDLQIISPSRLLFDEQSPTENVKKRQKVGSACVSSQMGTPAVEYVSDTDGHATHSQRIPITESDEFFRLQLMSDSVVSDDDLWPCKSPSPAITPLILSEKQAAAKSAIGDPAVPLSTQVTQRDDDQTEQQLSWSTIDWNSQQSIGKLEASENGVIVLTNSADVLPVKLRSPGQPRHRKCNVTSRHSLNGVELQTEDAETAADHLSTPDQSAQCKSSKDIVNQSWSEDDEIIVLDDVKLPATQPPPVIRKNRLKEVLEQPMRKPQFEDANSTFLSQPNVSADYVSSQDSFRTAASVLATQEEVDSNSTIIVEPIPKPVVAAVASTSTASGAASVNLYINKCASCLKDETKTCHVNELKSHAMYSKLMYTFKVEDSVLMGYVCGFSGDWELVEQHFKSDGKVGQIWLQNDDRLLTNPSFKRKNMKILRKKFSDREVKTRRQFLLKHVQLTPKQRQLLLGMV